MVSVSVRLVIGLTVLQTAVPQCEVVSTNPAECGMRNSSDGWPFHVGLYRTEHNESLYFCGGTIVTSSLVIVSAHCVKPYRSEILTVHYGVSDLTQRDRTHWSRVETVIIHPDYRAPAFSDDIALLQLKDIIPFGTLSRPICLWPEQVQESETQGGDDLTGTRGTSVGWGIGAHNVYTSVLQSAITVVLRQSRCMEVFTEKLFEYNDFFCAVTPVCSGSGGSGFYVEHKDRFYLRGMTTFGIAPKGYYQCGVNTLTGLLNVAKYTGWIRDRIQELEPQQTTMAKSETPYPIDTYQQMTIGTVLQVAPANSPIVITPLWHIKYQSSARPPVCALVGRPEANERRFPEEKRNTYN